MNKKFYLTSIAVSATLNAVNVCFLAYRYNKLEKLRQSHIKDSWVIQDYANALFEVVNEQSPELLTDSRLEQPAYDLAFLNIELQELMRNRKNKNS